MNVLVVDDDEMVRFVLTQKLGECGFSTASAGDGATAIGLFEKDTFDAVLLDLKMPGMDGIETLKELLRRDPHVPVIMVTAFGDIATAVEAIKIGAYDFVEKPPQISRITLTVRRAIEKAALEREIRELGKTAAETSNLRQAYDKLSELDRLKTAFLSSISHELRTPLTSIIGYADINRSKLAKLTPHLTDGKAVRDMAQVEQNLKIITTESRRLTELIDNVLELIALEAGTAEWNWEPVSVPSLLEEVTAGQKSAFVEKGILLVTECSGDLAPVRGDRKRLSQVLCHLLSNALKFTAQGRVTCTAAWNGAGIDISIADTGIGIAPALHRVIFDRFRQLGDTLTDKPKGVGLGLPLCKLIVDYHGGTLGMESRPGAGSVFSIHLPSGKES